MKSDPNDSLEVRGGLGSGSLFLQTRNRGHKGAFVTGSAPQGPTRFQSPLSSILFNPEGNRNRISRRVKFWIERLIINSAGELSLSGISFRSLFMLMYIETHSFHRQHTQAPADSSPPSPEAPSRLACFQLLPAFSLLHSAALLPY